MTRQEVKRPRMKQQTEKKVMTPLMGRSRNKVDMETKLRPCETRFVALYTVNMKEERSVNLFMSSDKTMQHDGQVSMTASFFPPL